MKLYKLILNNNLLNERYGKISIILGKGFSKNSMHHNEDHYSGAIITNMKNKEKDMINHPLYFASRIRSFDVFVYWLKAKMYWKLSKPNVTQIIDNIVSVPLYTILLRDLCFNNSDILSKNEQEDDGNRVTARKVFSYCLDKFQYIFIGFYVKEKGDDEEDEKNEDGEDDTAGKKKVSEKGKKNNENVNKMGGYVAFHPKGDRELTGDELLIFIKPDKG